MAGHVQSTDVQQIENRLFPCDMADPDLSLNMFDNHCRHRAAITEKLAVNLSNSPLFRSLLRVLSEIGHTESRSIYETVLELDRNDAIHLPISIDEQGLTSQHGMFGSHTESTFQQQNLHIQLEDELPIPIEEQDLELEDELPIPIEEQGLQLEDELPIPIEEQGL